jgi:hypothetical protein
MVITPDGPLLGRCEGEASLKASGRAHRQTFGEISGGVVPVAELDGDEVGYLVAKVAEIKRQSSPVSTLMVGQRTAYCSDHLQGTIRK